MRDPYEVLGVPRGAAAGQINLGSPPAPLLLKPNITAPGSDIRSALQGSDSAYGSLSGTSMAGPHVAGLVALLISANPGLRGDVDELEDIIEQTAVKKTTTEGCGGDTATQVPNNTYGWGRIDALAAVKKAVALRSPADVLDAAFDEIDAMIAADPSKRGQARGRPGEARDRGRRAPQDAARAPGGAGRDRGRRGRDRRPPCRPAI